MKLFLTALLLALVAMGLDVQAEESPSLRMVQTIPLPNVEGRIDHLTIDLKGQRLFIAALGNNTVEAVDLRAGERTQSIRGLREPQGVSYVPELNKLFVANGKSGACDVFDGSSLKRIKSVKLSDDADNIRYDVAAGRIYVGYSGGALGILDAASGDRIGDIELNGHPESFQLEKSGPRIFVNIPTAKEIAVVDRERRAVIAAWPTGDFTANYPMALGERHHRLFVGFRRPARLLVLDTARGRVVANLESLGDADDIFYDSGRGRVYVVGGEGSIGVFQQRDADHYEPMPKIPTAPGARTALFVPELNRLYVAVPHRGGQRAELRVYEARP
jgi:hypothetical protein